MEKQVYTWILPSRFTSREPYVSRFPKHWEVFHWTVVSHLLAYVHNNKNPNEMKKMYVNLHSILVNDLNQHNSQEQNINFKTRSSLHTWRLWPRHLTSLVRCSPSSIVLIFLLFPFVLFLFLFFFNKNQYAKQGLVTSKQLSMLPIDNCTCWQFFPYA